jgi:methionyl-tRNA formyltransferase
MRIVFAGTPEFALPALAVLGDAELCAVLTAPDRPAGRGGVTRASPVKRAAQARGLTVLQPELIGRRFSAEVARLRPDLLVAVAYGKIFRPYFLTVFGRGGVNLHPSLLPQLRGPAPMPAAILAGAARTGVTVQRLAAAMDAGDILAQTEVALDGTETTATLTARLARLGAALLWEVVDACATGTVAGRPQAEADATYCPLLTKEAGLIDWSRPARAIERAVRAYDPWPRAYTTWNGRRLVILEASVATEAAGAAGEVPGRVGGVDRRRGILVHTGRHGLWLRRLQLEGRKPVDWLAFANGQRAIAHARLGS